MKKKTLIMICLAAVFSVMIGPIQIRGGSYLAGSEHLSVTGRRKFYEFERCFFTSQHAISYDFKWCR